MRKNISVTNSRVLDALNGADNASKLIEEAILYYIDNSKDSTLTLEDVKKEVLTVLYNLGVMKLVTNNIQETIKTEEDKTEYYKDAVLSIIDLD